jgi:hypothetical protein
MQRRARKVERKAGLSATPSARALIIRLPMAGSLAQAGIRPQRTGTNSRSPPSPWRTILSSRPGRLRTIGMICVGAMFQRGTSSRGIYENSAPKARSISFGSA